eukprot:m.107010 g.107010  ORF g.107010 m.107010 type:complete len:478 (-) comp8963_c1_seq2:157-1590(-)
MQVKALLKGKPVALALDDTGLAIGDTTLVPLREIWSVHHTLTSVTVHCVRRSKKCRWRPLQLVFFGDEREMGALSAELHTRIAQVPNRPRRIKVFINPFGGKRQATKNMAAVRGLFVTAGISLDEVVTTHGSQAGTWMQSAAELSSFDAVMVVGGDGLFHEIANGMLARADRQIIPIGIIPSGSTDTVAYSASGTNDIITCALHIIVGDHHALDVCKLTMDDGSIRYATNFLGFGYFSDVLWESDKHRWMGPARYDYSGFLSILRWKKHRLRIRYVEANSPSSECYCGDAVCLPARTPHGPAADPPPATAWKEYEGPTRTTNIAVLPLKSDKTVGGFAPGKHLADGSLHLIHIRQCSRIQFIRFLLHVAFPSWDQFKLPFVEKIPCSHVQLIFEPGDGAMNIDGEAVAGTAAHAEVLPAGLIIYARGVERVGTMASPLVAQTSPASYGTRASPPKGRAVAATFDESAEDAPLLLSNS